MAIGVKPTTDQDIRQAALAKFACAHVAIVPQLVNESSMHGDGGRWLVLSIRKTDAADWCVVGRRRTRSELLILAGRGEVDYRTCPRSG